MRLFRHLRAWLRRNRLDDEMRDELAQHVALRAEEFEAAGLPPAEARRQASIAVGSAVRLREDARAIWGFPALDTIGQDVRYGLRQIRRAPVVAAVAIASLAVAIGAGTAVFALARAALYREAGIVHPEQVLALRWHAPADATLFRSFDGSSDETGGTIGGTSFAYPALQQMASGLDGEADVAGYADLYRSNVTVNGEARMTRGQVVSGSYFPVLGVRPAAGRLLQPSDDAPAGDVIVLSHPFWMARFGGRPDAIGAHLLLNGVSFTVVGVAPPSFRGSLQAGTTPDVYVPISARDRILHDGEHMDDATYWWVQILVRPRPGVAVEAVRAKAETLLRASASAANPALSAASRPTLELAPGGYGDPYTREGLRDPLRLLTWSIVALLLVACVNVAGLQVARAAAREHEMGVRLAMGAGRGRLLRQVMTESLVLALTGGAAGLLLASAGAQALLPALRLEADSTLDLATDWRMALVGTAVAVVSGVLLGLAPAWRASGTSASIVSAGSLGRRGSTSSPRLRLGRALLVCQMALSLALLFVALLLVQSHRRLAGVETGLDTRNLAFFSVNPLLNGYAPDHVQQYWRRSLERVRAIPGVVHASITTHPLIANSSSSSRAHVRQPDGSDKETQVYRMSVGDDFFATMGIVMRSGRPIEARDTASGVFAAVVNETMARKVFARAAPLGARFRLSTLPKAPEYEVVGVAADARYNTLRGAQQPIAYLSLAQNSSPGDMTIYVRTAAGGDLAPALIEAMREVDSTVPVFNVRTQQAQIDRYLAQPRFFALLGTAIGATTLLLACIGLYGLLSYAVTRRTPEIGVRLALGARPSALASSVMTESLVLAGIGVCLGLPAAYGLGRAAAASLFGVEPTSPPLFASAAVILTCVAAAAAFLPARRASQVDPLVALRHE